MKRLKSYKINPETKFGKHTELLFLDICSRIVKMCNCTILDTRNNGQQQYRNNNVNANKPNGSSGSSYGSPPPHFATPPHYPQMHPHHQDMLGKACIHTYIKYLRCNNYIFSPWRKSRVFISLTPISVCRLWYRRSPTNRRFWWVFVGLPRIKTLP